MGLPSGFSFCQPDGFQKLANRNGVRLVELKAVFQIKKKSAEMLVQEKCHKPFQDLNNWQMTSRVSNHEAGSF